MKTIFPVRSADRRRITLTPAKYASLTPQAPADMLADLKAKHEDQESDSIADMYAYCDTAFESFNGDFESFQSRRAGRAMDSLAVFNKALRQAERCPEVVALIRSEGGSLAEWLSTSPAATVAANRRRVVRVSRVPA